MDIIQEVGAYAGFAAVIGLAVLAALYFSQARDVRRLREWAGRAPERAAEQGVPGQTVLPEQAAQEAVRPAPSGAVRPIPAAKPAPAAAAGAKPATATGPAVKAPATPPGAKPAPATPGAKPAPATPGAKPASPATPGAKPASPAEPGVKPAPDGPVKPGQVAPVPATAAATPAVKAAPGAPAAPAKPATPPPAPARPPAVPPRPGPVARSPASAASQSTAVLPASARLRETGGRSGPSRREGLGARYIALIVAGVIVIGAAAAFGVSQLGGDDKPATSDSEPDGDDRQAPINPTTVTVSVLNGTTVPGLAAQIGDEVETAGFQRGNVANAIDQQRTSSIVLFAEGADREARLVARRLGIAQVDLVDPDSQALAGNASVVVIVGADQTQ